MTGKSAFTVFGEVLFDRFSDGYQVLGGAPFNVAWHLQALGLAPLFISRVGDDAAGEQIRQAMQNWGMDTTGLQLDHQYPTGAVEVKLNGGEPSYEILANQAYDFIHDDDPVLPNCRILYHGSLALRQPVSRASFSQLSSRYQGPIFLDVNLRAPWWRADDLQLWLAGADWVKLNETELQQLHPSGKGLEQQMQDILRAYQLSGLIVTRGAAGASALQANGELVCVSPAHAISVVDCVGAGDAFSAISLLGIYHSWPLALTMHRAQDFAASLIGQRGATPADPGFYRRFRQDWQIA
ncbi:carbohydrate kinase [Methylomonas paludis]|uniref:Carbohydrate kinase n=1 Tax=Methylomonas paludis TaxID=1173101 RepID=A0A975ML70_9GAMM|nr:carbohydrate kinase [Methylomonas paludis]QWF69570.1 carbohydrate kinase [Methylomonas paludis]